MEGNRAGGSLQMQTKAMKAIKWVKEGEKMWEGPPSARPCGLVASLGDDIK